VSSPPTGRSLLGQELRNTSEHAMLIAVWNMLTNGVFYSEPGGDF
jgi:hypothetical protein